MSLWCISFELGSQNFWAPIWNFDLAEPHQPQPQNPQDFCSMHKHAKAAVIYCLLAHLEYLCLIKSVIHTILSNIYLWTCCYGVCIGKMLRHVLLSLFSWRRPSLFSNLSWAESCPLGCDFIPLSNFQEKWNAPLFKGYERATMGGRAVCPSRLSLCLDGVSVCVFLGLGPAREGKTTLAEPNVVHKWEVSFLQLWN